MITNLGDFSDKEKYLKDIIEQSFPKSAFMNLINSSYDSDSLQLYNDSTSNPNVWGTGDTGNQIPVVGSLQFLPNTITSGSITYTIGNEVNKELIYEVIRKIIKGGKPQIIISLSSDNELEKEIAELLIKFIAMWKKESEDE